MLRIFKSAFDAIVDLQQRRARARLFEQLDERTLRDIGLDTEANRRRERVRAAQARFALY